jgi:putative lipoic acid-binding regulatory protein
MTEETLLEFPCDFPIKLMGKNTDEFAALAKSLVEQHAGTVDDNAIKSSVSKNNRFVSLTITITAHNKQQLDSIYQDATDHPEVLMAL